MPWVSLRRFWFAVDCVWGRFGLAEAFDARRVGQRGALRELCETEGGAPIWQEITLSRS